VWHAQTVDTAVAELATFSSAEVCARAGITYRKLDYWCRTGVLRPLVDATGSGSQRRFSSANLAAARAAGQLAALGAPTKVRAAVAAEMAELDEGPGDWLVVTPAGRIFRSDDLGSLVAGLPAVLHDALAGVWVVDLRDALDEPALAG